MQSLAGWVLAGGYGRRFGSDKALLLVNGEPLVARTARLIGGVTGPVTLIGRAERLNGLAFPAVDDFEAGQGPLAGILTALSITGSEWNLVCACDFPHLNRGMLLDLIETASRSDAGAVVPRTAGGKIQPLCAMYRASSLEPLRAAYGEGKRAVWKALETIEVQWVDTADSDWAFNLNTPQDLNALHQDRPNVG